MSDKEVVALLPGRFQPLHRGHMALARHAIKRGATQLTFAVRDVKQDGRNLLRPEDVKYVLLDVFRDWGCVLHVQVVPDLGKRGWGRRVLQYVGHVDLVYAVNPRLRAEFRGLVPLGDVSQRMGDYSATSLRKLARDIKRLHRQMLKLAPDRSVDALVKYELEL